MDVLQPVERRPVPLTLRVTWPFITMVLLLAVCATASLYILSTVRAFVAGESLWTKGQKDAIYFLNQYAITGSPQAFEGFTRAMEIPLGDRAARLALEPGQVQTDVARDGFLRGGNHPDDIDGLIWLLRYFDGFDLVKKPVDQWLVGDEYIRALRELSHEIHQRNTAGTADAPTRERWQNTIREINAGVTPAARNFSDALGESSRHIVLLLMWTNMGIALVLILLTLWHTHKLLAQRQNAERALEVERELARTTLAAIGDAVVTTNIHGEVTYMNPAAETLLARPAALATGQPLAQLLVFEGDAPPLSADALVQTLLRSDGAAKGNIHRTLVRPDQSIVPVRPVSYTHLTLPTTPYV